MCARLVGCVVVLVSLPAQGEAPTERAAKLYARGDYAGAVDQYRLAYMGSRKPELFVKMAECYEKLQQFDQGGVVLQVHRQQSARREAQTDRAPRRPVAQRHRRAIE
jgi:hypothetical protein